MGIKPIGLSFKNNEEDEKLYKWIISHSNMSGFIKDTLRAAKDGDKSFENGKAPKSDKKPGLIELDF